MNGAALKTVKTIKLLLVSSVVAIVCSSQINAQKVNLDSLNNAVIINHLAGLELIQKGEKTEGLKKFYKSIEAFNEIDYLLLEKRDSMKLVIEDWLKASPQSPLINYFMGNIIYLTKRDSAGLAQAKEYFNRSKTLEPNFISPYRGLASIAQFEKNDEEAIKNFRRILEIDSTHYSTYLRFASHLARMGNISEAEALYKKIIAHDTSGNNKVWASISLADNKKNYSEKKNLYNSSLAYANTQSDSLLIYQKLVFLTAEEAPGEFPALAEELLAGKIGNVRQLRMNILYIYFQYLKKYDPSKILGFANRIIEEKHPLVFLMIANYLAYEKKDYENALKFCKKAYEITNSESVYQTIRFGRKEIKGLEKLSNQFKYGSVSFTMGKIYMGLNQYKNAEEYLMSALPFSETTRNWEPYFLLSKIKEEEGNITEAANLLVKALSIKEVPETRKKLEELNKKLGNNEAASQLIKKERERNAIVSKDFTLKTLNGKLFRLSDQKGKVVLLDFWATWCGPCVAALPQMVKLFEKYSNNQNVVFQSVDVDESEQTIKEFLSKKNYSFNILLANGTDVQKDYEVTGIPTLFIIDKKGKIQFKHIGFNKEENIVESLSGEIDELLLEN